MEIRNQIHNLVLLLWVTSAKFSREAEGVKFKKKKKGNIWQMCPIMLKSGGEKGNNTLG